jgi:hypothetical protein
MILTCCVISCNKQDDILMPLPGNNSTIKSKPVVGGAVYTVSPSGTFNDSPAIQQAFDNAVAAGPGSTVLLTEGVFYLNEGIEVDGFDGFFKGTDKLKTYITTENTINFNIPEQTFEWDLPGLFVFRNGNIHISDMTIEIYKYSPCIGTGIDDILYGALPCVFSITGNSVVNPPITEQIINSTFNNVRFFGGIGAFNGYNVNMFIAFGPEGYPNYLINGDHKITNCEFRMAKKGIVSWITSNGTFTIGGVPSSGNIFTDIDFAVRLFGCRNSYINISNNSFTQIYSGAILLNQLSYLIPFTEDLPLSRYIVQNNDFEVERYGDAILLGDSYINFGDEKKMDAIVSNNKIYLNNTFWGGICGYNVNDVLVTNNKIWGNGIAAIYCGLDYYKCSNWVLNGNNVELVDARVAPIWLSSTTSNFTVIGGSNKTNVRDDGTGNILTGVNNIQGNPPGPEIHEAMMRKLEIMKSFKRLEMR